MWDPRAKLILRLCLFTIYLTVTECNYRRRWQGQQVTASRGSQFIVAGTNSSAKNTFKEEHLYKGNQDYIRSQEFIKKGRSLLANVKVTNKAFCAEMILTPEDYYLVLPWWYNYCHDLQKKNPAAGDLKGYISFDAIHKYLLGEVQLYKERLKEPKITYSELEEELVSLKK